MDPQIVTIVIAIAGATGAILSFMVGRRERQAGAEASEGSAAQQISDGYKKLIDSLETRVSNLEEEKDEARKQYRIEMERMKLENRELMLENSKLKISNEELQERIEALETWKNNQPSLPGLTGNATE